MNLENAFFIGIIAAGVYFYFSKKPSEMPEKIKQAEEEVNIKKQELEIKHDISSKTKGTYEQAKNAFINRFGRAGVKPSDPKS